MPRIYVIESRWDWNEHHTEYATLNLEHRDFDGKPIKDLEDPSCPAKIRKSFFARFKKIAELQSGYYKGAFVLVAVYRLMLPPEETEGSNNLKRFNVLMKPIFHFEGRKPIRVF